MMRTLSFALASALALAGTVQAQQLNPVRIALVEWANGLAKPVGLANCGDERLFVIEQAGRIRIVADSMEVLSTPFLNISGRVTSSGNEQGLLALAFPPDYATSGAFYVMYTTGQGSGTTRLSRFFVTADPNVADPDSEEIILTQSQPYTNHNGGDMHFGPDGYLYLALGDGGSGNDPGNNGQNLTNLLGTMIRIDVSGEGTGYTVPEDNPYVGAGGDTIPAIWAHGLRNPWRFSIDPVGGTVWIGDVGQDAFEEVDRWPVTDHSGPNFGWRCREGNIATPGINQTNCGPASAYVSPVFVVGHSNTSWCSVVGGHVYHGTRWPHLAGRYIFTDYCAGAFLSMTDANVVDTLLLSNQYGYTGFGVDIAGEHYVTFSSGSNGRVRKIIDACPMDAPVVTELAGVLSAAPAGNAYQWFRNGVSIAGATQQSYTPQQNGNFHVRVNYGTPCLLRSEAVAVSGVGMPDLASIGLQVLPQPADEALFIVRDGAEGAAYGLELLDATGRVVRADRLAAGPGRVRIELGGVASGMYVLRVSEAGRVLLGHPVVVAH